MSDGTNILHGLNDKQIKTVLFDDSRVQAQAGSGKQRLFLV